MTKHIWKITYKKAKICAEIPKKQLIEDLIFKQHVLHVERGDNLDNSISRIIQPYNLITQSPQHNGIIKIYFYEDIEILISNNEAIIENEKLDTLITKITLKCSLEAIETKDKKEIEELCKAKNIFCNWRQNNNLDLFYSIDLVDIHSITGKFVLFPIMLYLSYTNVTISLDYSDTKNDLTKILTCHGQKYNTKKGDTIFLDLSLYQIYLTKEKFSVTYL